MQGHTVPHLKALRYDIHETREFSCGSTSSICQDIFKGDNLLHKWCFVKAQSLRTLPKHLTQFLTASNALAVLGITLVRPFNRVLEISLNQ